MIGRSLYRLTGRLVISNAPALRYLSASPSLGVPAKSDISWTLNGLTEKTTQAKAQGKIPLTCSELVSAYSLFDCESLQDRRSLLRSLRPYELSVLLQLVTQKNEEELPRGITGTLRYPWESSEQTRNEWIDDILVHLQDFTNSTNFIQLPGECISEIVTLMSTSSSHSEAYHATLKRVVDYCLAHLGEWDKSIQSRIVETLIENCDTNEYISKLMENLQTVPEFITSLLHVEALSKSLSVDHSIPSIDLDRHLSLFSSHQMKQLISYSSTTSSEDVFQKLQNYFSKDNASKVKTLSAFQLKSFRRIMKTSDLDHPELAQAFVLRAYQLRQDIPLEMLIELLQTVERYPSSTSSLLPLLFEELALALPLAASERQLKIGYVISAIEFIGKINQTEQCLLSSQQHWEEILNAMISLDQWKFTHQMEYFYQLSMKHPKQYKFVLNQYLKYLLSTEDPQLLTNRFEKFLLLRVTHIPTYEAFCHELFNSMSSSKVASQRMIKLTHSLQETHPKLYASFIEQCFRQMKQCTDIWQHLHYARFVRLMYLNPSQYHKLCDEIFLNFSRFTHEQWQFVLTNFSHHLTGFFKETISRQLAFGLTHYLNTTSSISLEQALRLVEAMYKWHCSIPTSNLLGSTILRKYSNESWTWYQKAKFASILVRLDARDQALIGKAVGMVEEDNGRNDESAAHFAKVVYKYRWRHFAPQFYKGLTTTELTVDQSEKKDKLRGWKQKLFERRKHQLNQTE